MVLPAGLDGEPGHGVVPQCQRDCLPSLALWCWQPCRSR